MFRTKHKKSSSYRGIKNGMGNLGREDIGSDGEM